MIAYLDGAAVFKGQRYVVINAGGIGYRVFVAPETLKKIPEKDESSNPSTSLRVKLWVHLYVREDALELYGFLHHPELEFFEMLINISGIGPKSGLGIMNIAPLDTLKRAIAAGDTSYLTRVSGIGRKTAEKIVLELREKMAGKGVLVEAPELKEEADALEALVSLGYSQSEAREALRRVPNEVISPEKRIKEALRNLGGAAK
ncbi:MAG: Holliday junction branch migration protein RuvA [Candidatus Sungbacteria bacterium]|nr:Holliday junction branch migration protein RuvA [Candidatus Sungbacteria bacterium]